MERRGSVLSELRISILLEELFTMKLRRSSTEDFDVWEGSKIKKTLAITGRIDQKDLRKFLKHYPDKIFGS